MPRLTVCHDSTKLICREPFGALHCGASVTLRLFVRGEGAEGVRAVLRTWNGEERFYEGGSENIDGGRAFVFNIAAPGSPGVLWYHFRLHSGNDFQYVGAEDNELRSGAAKLTRKLPHDFRITVYDPVFNTPESFRGRIAYQIFPDRFRRGEYPGLPSALKHHRDLGRRVTVKEWDEEVDHLPRDNEKYYSPQDYYLGNFRGVIDSIPYLKSLGVGALYLNPIFESAYNHRYSISDYMSVDPLLGTEEDFRRMAEALHGNDIKLILDGVFSHTGDDSIYFDRRGHYGNGAYHHPDSPYRNWYVFSEKYRHGYRCWWDFETLPEVDELEPSYMEFIGRVLEKWIRLGADGWRLDVADELPDEFIEYLRRRLKAADPEALLIGEVWEDAALKTDGFGRRRRYVNGAELDGVMDYPFADALLDFLLKRTDSARLKAILCAQLEGYPRDFMRAQLGLLDSHDTMRALSVLSGAPEKDSLPRPLQAVWQPRPEEAARGKRRLMLASALQFSMPFMPCVYYGDEAGLTGLTDPFCRRPYPWGREDAGLIAHYRRIARIRNEDPVFTDGMTAFAAPHPDVFAAARKAGNEAVTLINRSEEDITVSLTPDELSDGECSFTLRGSFRDAVSVEEYEAAGSLCVRVPALGFAVLISGRAL